MKKTLIIIYALSCFVACSGEQPSEQEDLEQEEQEQEEQVHEEQPREFSLRQEEEIVRGPEGSELETPEEPREEKKEQAPAKEKQQKVSLLDSILKKNFQKGDQEKRERAVSPQKKFQEKEKVAKKESKRQKPRVVELYVSKNCAECKATEEYLREQKIKYKKFNVGKKGKAYEQYYAIGGNGVFPFAKVGDSVVYGYDPQQIAILAQKQEQEVKQGRNENEF